MLKINDHPSSVNSFRSFHFTLVNGELPTNLEIDRRCSHCINRLTKPNKEYATILDPYYIVIINLLKASGLLDQNYEPICCSCYTLLEEGVCLK